MQTEIARLRELLEKATQGEFTLHKRSPTTIIASDGYSATNTDSNLFDANVRNEANAAALVAAINFLRSNDFALLALAEAVEAAPEGDVAYIAEDDAGGEVHVYTTKAVVRSCRTDLIDRRVRLVALPDGGEVGNG
jgi:hypothetical protein